MAKVESEMVSAEWSDVGAGDSAADIVRKARELGAGDSFEATCFLSGERSVTVVSTDDGVLMVFRRPKTAGELEKDPAGQLVTRVAISTEAADALCVLLQEVSRGGVALAG